MMVDAGGLVHDQQVVVFKENERFHAAAQRKWVR
jgi:hypothetical protein